MNHLPDIFQEPLITKRAVLQNSATQPASCGSFIEPVAHTQLICNIVLLSRLISELSSDIRHIDLQLLDAAFLGIAAPDRLDDGSIGHHFAALPL